MEKRLFSAIILSLLVLYVWVGLTQPLRRNRQNAQVVENKDVIDNSTKSTTPPPPPSLEEKLITLEGQKLAVTFNTKGAAITEAHIKDYSVSLPVKNIGMPVGFENVNFHVEQPTGRTIQFSSDSVDRRLIIEYEISEKDYIIHENIKITGLQEMSKLDNIDIRALTLDMSSLDIHKENFARERGLLEYVVNSYSGISRKSNAYKFDLKEEKHLESHVVWAGFRDRYYCAILRPQFETKGYTISRKNEHTLDININVEPAEGRSADLSSVIFIGPEKYDVLKSYNLDLEKIKRFYRPAILNIIAMSIYQLMDWIHKIVPNWGATIILISTLIYSSMYPLTLKGMSSMKRMQAIQPEINKLKEKYSDNPQKMNQEMMRLYKEYKINPLGGCLPLLLQMPIFIGLYQVLWRSVTFKGASFLWIKDLSQPDRLFMLPSSLPFIGQEINLLPILMMIIMFVQQKITAKNMVVTDPMQLQQQKMMGIFMPVFLGIIFYKFASGLTLYFTMFYSFSTFTQFHMYTQKRAKS